MRQTVLFCSYLFHTSISWTRVSSGLPLRLITFPPKPLGILTEWSTIVSLSKPLNLELDLTLYQTRSIWHLTKSDSSETKIFRFFTFIYLIMNNNSDHIAIVYILQKWSNSSFILDTTLVIVSEELVGGLRRTFHWVPRVLNCLHSLVCPSIISNFSCDILLTASQTASPDVAYWVRGWGL